MNITRNMIAFSENSVCCENCWLHNFTTNENCSSELLNKKTLNREEKKYNKGAYLIKSGVLVSGVYCIQKGTVKIFKKGIKNKDFIMWVAGKGDIIGLNSFINDEVYSFSASALSETSACFITSSDLQILLSKKPLAFVQLMKNVCDKINFVEQRITSISKKTIKQQFAEILITISKNNPDSDKNVVINYSVKDLANFVGTTKNYLYKILLEFTNKKILSINNRKFIISNMNALSLIATGADKLNK
ncbi:MAG: Crp/Fnr family transcriptional regulator [Bacteroidetes bacterium]|nr:Crp/Fnr family transcriptional regulator [Bacteroidota bacterium]